MPDVIDTLLPDFNNGLCYKHSVFLSYSTRQEKQTKALYEKFKAQGLETFFAPLSLQPDSVAPEQFVELLQMELLQSIQVVVLLTKSYLDSAWCLLEMHAAFSRIGSEKPRRLWIIPVEPVEDQLIGQLVPFLFRGADEQLVATVARIASSCDVRIGDRFADVWHVPKLFVELPLRQFYEPPTSGNRPPWGKDDRSPHGVPGAPAYDAYERLVREYMVQIMRGYSPGRLDIPVLGLSDRYAFVSEDAECDARRLLALGVSPFQRPYTRSVGDWLREIEIARAQGQDPAEMDCLEGAALINAGTFDRGIQLIQQSLAVRADMRDRDFFVTEAARGAYLVQRFEQAIDLLALLSEPLPQMACLVRDAVLVRKNQLSTSQYAANQQSDISVDDMRINSELERREDVDYWAEGLELAGYPR